MMFCKIVCPIQFAFSPQDMELVLPDSITDPVESHVYCFGAFLFDGVVGNSGRCGVVSDDGCGWLGVAEFFEANADGAGLFGVVEHCCKFSFGCRQDDFAEDLARHVDGSVWF